MSCEGCEEGAYVIDKLAKLLAEIAIIVNGPEPPLTRWSYHDLPEKVRALKDAQQPAAAAVPNRMPDIDPAEDQRAADYHNGWNDCRAAMLAQQPAAAVPEDAFSALLNCASRTAMLAAARKGAGNEQ